MCGIVSVRREHAALTENPPTTWAVKRDQKGYAVLCCFPSYFLYPPFFLLLSNIVVTRIRGHIAGSSPPSPLRHVPCIYIARRGSTLSSFVDSRCGQKLRITCSIAWPNSTCKVEDHPEKDELTLDLFVWINIVHCRCRQ